MKLNQWQIVGLILVVSALAFYGWRNFHPSTQPTTRSATK